MAETLILAIDQGTSSTKTVIVDVRGDVVAKASADLASSFPRAGFVEQDPVLILRSARESVERCVASLCSKGRDPRDIAACGISNQRETFLLWDGAGKPLTPAVVWQCKRSVTVCRRLRAQGMAAEIKARTGLLLDPYFSATKLLWLMENDREVASAVRTGRAFFGTVDSWLLFHLSRGEAFATDLTNASRTMLFNTASLGWDQWLLERWGLQNLRLPAVYPSAHSFGVADCDGALPRPVPVTAMIGDSHAAAFGEGCLAPGTAKATLGTGSSVLLNVGNRRLRSKENLVDTICWSTADRMDYAQEGIVVSCGATIAWLRDNLGLFASSGETEAMARRVSDNGGVHVIPGFSGMGAPWWKEDATAAICGLRFDSTKDHIARAALESIPFQIADVLSCMRTDTGTALTELKADGAITANSFVMELMADVVGIPVTTMGVEEVSALGAASLAGFGAGLYPLEAVATFGRRGRRYEPGPGAETAQRWHEEWKQTITRYL